MRYKKLKKFKGPDYLYEIIIKEKVCENYTKRRANETI